MARPHMVRPSRMRERRDAGMATAEYAVATVAACGFGGVLVKLLTSSQVTEFLVKLLTKAFSFAF